MELTQGPAWQPHPGAAARREREDLLLQALTVQPTRACPGSWGYLSTLSPAVDDPSVAYSPSYRWETKGSQPLLLMAGARENFPGM